MGTDRFGITTGDGGREPADGGGDAWARAGGDFFGTAATAPPPPPAAAAPPYGAPTEFGSQVLTAEEAAQLSRARTASETRMGVAGGVIPIGRRLGFWEAVNTGLNLVRSSWSVVTRAPSLLGVSAICLAFGIAVILAYAEAIGGLDALETGGRFAVAVKTFPLLAVTCSAGVVAQAVIVVVARDMFEGKRTSVAKGWAAAMTRLPQLIGFGLIFAAERTLTNALRNMRGGKWIARAVDYSWDFATYLAVPAIMFEPGVGPFGSVKRSVQLVRTRFGVQLAATGVISLAVFVCAFPLVLAALILGAMASAATAIVLVIGVLLAVMVVAATLQGVCSAAMYRFVTTGAVGGNFTEAELMRVFGSRPAGATA